MTHGLADCLTLLVTLPGLLGNLPLRGWQQRVSATQWRPPELGRRKESGHQPGERQKWYRRQHRSKAIKVGSHLCETDAGAGMMESQRSAASEPARLVIEKVATPVIEFSNQQCRALPGRISTDGPGSLITGHAQRSRCSRWRSQDVFDLFPQPAICRVTFDTLVPVQVRFQTGGRERKGKHLIDRSHVQQP